MDLFALSWNRQLNYFVNWKHKPNAIEIDALSHNLWLVKSYHNVPREHTIQKCRSHILTPLKAIAAVVPANYGTHLRFTEDSASEQKFVDRPRDPHPLLMQQSCHLVVVR